MLKWGEPRLVLDRHAPGTQTSKVFRSAEFCSAETALQEQRGESPLGAQASGPCSIRLGGEV